MSPFIVYKNPETPEILLAFDHHRFWQHVSSLRADGYDFPQKVEELYDEWRDKIEVIVVRRGGEWVDLPMEEGQGYYRTHLSYGKLLRGIILVEWLRDQRGLFIEQIEQQYMDLEGGGQIASSRDEVGQPLDRFTVDPKRIDLLLDHLKETETIPVFAILQSLYERLHTPSQEPRRFRMALRWFKNFEGRLPPLKEGFADLSGTILDQIEKGKTS